MTQLRLFARFHPTFILATAVVAVSKSVAHAVTLFMTSSAIRIVLLFIIIWF